MNPLYLFPHKQIGWEEIGEDFIRFTIFTTPWFTIYLHRLVALVPHSQCHDHPWSFMAILLKGGYDEYHAGEWVWRKPGSVLWRPAEWKHNVVTKNSVSWSIIVTGPKKRQWGFVERCE